VPCRSFTAGHLAVPAGWFRANRAAPGGAGGLVAGFHEGRGSARYVIRLWLWSASAGGHPGPFQGRPLLCESLHGRALRGLRRRALRHYYFRDFWRAGTGMLPALRILAALGGQDWPLSQLTGGYTRYVASGEINCHVDDVPARLDEVGAAWTRRGLTPAGSAA